MPFHQDSGFKRRQRQKFIREIRTERITPEELLQDFA
jgi:hypothetical protein